MFTYKHFKTKIILSQISLNEWSGLVSGAGYCVFDVFVYHEPVTKKPFRSC